MSELELLGGDEKAPKAPRVIRSPLRCPYCHEQVALRGTPWVACSSCLARHHADCWMGQGGCASCMGRRALLPANALGTAQGRLGRGSLPPRRRRSPLVIGALLVLFQLGITVVGLEILGAEAEVPDSTDPAPLKLPSSLELQPIKLREDVRVVSLELLERLLTTELELLRERRHAQKDEPACSKPHLGIGSNAVMDPSQVIATLKEEERREAERRLCELYAAQAVPTVWLTAPAPINGKVLAVRSDVSPARVLLSVGSHEGVQPGLTFTIYRGSTFVAKVLVERVLPGSAGCRVLFTADGQEVRARDLAATRLQ